MAKKMVQKDKLRSTKYTHKAKDRLTRTPLQTGIERRCSGRISSGTRRSKYLSQIVHDICIA